MNKRYFTGTGKELNSQKYPKLFTKYSDPKSLISKSCDENHFTNICEMYDNLFGYINTLPSFHIGFSYASKLLINLAEKHGFSKKKKFLDLCCGIGNSMRFIAENYDFIFTGIDLNSNQVSEGRKRNEEKNHNNINIIRGNVLEIDEGIGRFDIIWSEDSFSHIPNRRKLFETCYKILSEDGLFIFSDLIKTNLISEVEINKYSKSWCLSDVETYESYLNSLKQNGFNILESKYKTGKKLIKFHVKEEKKNKESSPRKYIRFLNSNKEILINKWGEHQYYNKLERMKTYRWLIKGKIDYVFFVCNKLR